MSPIQHRAYKKNAVPSGNAAENVALLLEQAATHMSAVEEAIHQKDIEKRCRESARAVFILSGLRAALVRDTPEQTRISNTFSAFYNDMETLIMRTNIFNSGDTARSIADGFLKMARAWRHVSVASKAPLVEPVISSATLQA